MKYARKRYGRFPRARRARLARAAVRRRSARASRIRSRRMRAVIPRSLIETKMVRTVVTMNVHSVSDPNFVNFGVQPMSPYPPTANLFGLNIAQGTGQGNRIGNRIKLVSATLKYCYRPNPYFAGPGGSVNVAPQPHLLRIYLFTLKDNQQLDTAAQANSVFRTDFFNDGNSSQGATSTFDDIVRPFNTDVVTVHKVITRKIGNSASNVRADGTLNPGTAQFQFFQNNDFKLYASGTINVLKYQTTSPVWNDSSTAVAPSGRKLYAAFTVCSLYGTIDSTLQQGNITYCLTYKYKDA